MNIDPQEIVRLYVEENRSVREIANRFGSSYGRIYGILRSRVIMRSSGGRGRPRDAADFIRIAEIIRERVVTGDWPTGHKIRTPGELAQTFGVSHQTIRDAVAHLRRRGYLALLTKGTYVRPPRDWESDKQ